MLAEADRDIAKFLDYWRQLCAGRVMPAKSDLNPVDIRAALPHLSLHERKDRDSFVYLVHGTALASTASGDHTGQDIFDAVPDAWRHQLMMLLNAMLDHPCGAREEHVLQDPIVGHVHRDGLHLPMSDDAGNVTYLLSYYPPVQRGDEVSISVSREPDSIRQPVGILDIEFIDIGQGLPAFAEQATAAAKQLTEKLMAG
jgi:hypothetical protein